MLVSSVNMIYAAFLFQMSSQDTRKRSSNESPIGRIPKLPPIEQYQKASARFDNSPLLKYRKSKEMKDLLGNIV